MKHKFWQARALLVDLLRDGPRSATEIHDAARAAGISIGTLHNAKDALGIQPEKAKGQRHGEWLWMMGAEPALSDAELDDFHRWTERERLRAVPKPASPGSPTSCAACGKSRRRDQLRRLETEFVCEQCWQALDALAAQKQLRKPTADLIPILRQQRRL
jgi:hypothetical protein